MPVGTVITDAETGEMIADLAAHGQTALLAKGGQGGLGNLHFKSSTNRAPRQSTPGEEGEQRQLRLELKVLADVGLLGMPNAGKSTLIRAISAARPKVADYPFTTLAPNLGVVRVDENRSFVVADVPGLIEGAAEGAGLGHQFLRHLQRTRLLLHIVDLAPLDGDADPVAGARAIVRELERYDRALYDKPRWLVLNKTDLIDSGRTQSARCRIRQVVPMERSGVHDRRDQRRRLSRSRLRRPALAGSASLPKRSPQSHERDGHDIDRRRRAAAGDQGRIDAGHRRRARHRSRRRRPLGGTDRGAVDVSGKELVLVSSGAIVEGMKRLGWTTRPVAIHELQAAAAVGQMGLVQAYETAFKRFGLHTAQILLTHEDLPIAAAI